MSDVARQLKEARSQYGDAEVLQEYLKQNPDKKSVVEQAVKTGATPSDILDEIIKQHTPTFLGDVKRDFNERAQQADTIAKNYDEGKISYPSAVLQTAGKVGVGGVLDIIGEGVGHTLGAITPDPIENYISEKLNNAGQSEVVSQVIDRYRELKKAHPELVGDVEALTNVAAMFSPVKGVGGGKSLVAKAGDKLVKSGKGAMNREKSKFIKRMLTQDNTKQAREAVLGRTKERGLLKTTVVKPTKDEKAVHNVLMGIKDISPKKTIRANYNVVEKHIGRVANKLEDAVKANNAIFPKRELKATFRNAFNVLDEHPIMVGDARKQAEKYFTKFEQLIDKHGSSGYGLLKARKEFDRWVKKNKPRVFDSKTENATKVAVDAIRNTANDFLHSKIKNVNVRKYLKIQRNLYKAKDLMKYNAQREGINAIARAIQRVGDAIPLKGVWQKIGGAGALIGGTALTGTLPTLVNTLGGLYIVGKSGQLVLSGKARVFYGRVLKQIDKAIKSTNDKGLLKELRADRAYILKQLKDEDRKRDRKR